MNISTILKELSQAHDYFPHDAIDAALQNKKEITPHLLSVLGQAIEKYQSAINEDRIDYIYAMVLLAQFREESTFPLLIKAAHLDQEWAEEFFTSEIIEILAQILISTYNNDLAALKSVIEDEQANIWIRKAALTTLLGLVAQKKITREEVIAYIKTLFHSPLIDNNPMLCDFLIEAAADLYPEELMPEITKAFAEDKAVDLFGQEWIQERLTMGKQACLNEYIYNNESLSPIDDIEEAMVGCSEDDEECCQNEDGTCEDEEDSIDEVTLYIIQKMLNKGVDLKAISAATGLSIEDIESLSAQE